MCFVGVGFGLVVGLGSVRLGFGVRYRCRSPVGSFEYL